MISAKLDKKTKYRVLLIRLNTSKSKRLSELIIVQYNIWLDGNMKLKKNITKQNKNAKKLFPPSNLYFSRCLNLLDEFE